MATGRSFCRCAGGALPPAWPISRAFVAATLANHAVRGICRRVLGGLLDAGPVLDAIVGVSMLAMAAWTLKPDKLDEDDALSRASATSS